MTQVTVYVLKDPVTGMYVKDPGEMTTRIHEAWKVERRRSAEHARRRITLAKTEVVEVRITYEEVINQ